MFWHNYLIPHLTIISLYNHSLKVCFLFAFFLSVLNHSGKEVCTWGNILNYAQNIWIQSKKKKRLKKNIQLHLKDQEPCRHRQHGKRMKDIKLWFSVLVCFCPFSFQIKSKMGPQYLKWTKMNGLFGQFKFWLGLKMFWRLCNLWNVFPGAPRVSYTNLQTSFGRRTLMEGQ